MDQVMVKFVSQSVVVKKSSEGFGLLMKGTITFEPGDPHDDCSLYKKHLH